MYCLVEVLLDKYESDYRVRQSGSVVNRRMKDVLKARVSSALAIPDDRVLWDEGDVDGRLAGSAVVVSDEGERYQVVGAYKQYSACTCPDAVRNGYVCKHQLKVLMLGKDVPPVLLVRALGTLYGTVYGGMGVLDVVQSSSSVPAEPGTSGLDGAQGTNGSQFQSQSQSMPPFLDHPMSQNVNTDEPDGLKGAPLPELLEELNALAQRAMLAGPSSALYGNCKFEVMAILRTLKRGEEWLKVYGDYQGLHAWEAPVSGDYRLTRQKD